MWLKRKHVVSVDFQAAFVNQPFWIFFSYLHCSALFKYVWPFSGHQALEGWTLYQRFSESNGLFIIWTHGLYARVTLLKIGTSGTGVFLWILKKNLEVFFSKQLWTADISGKSTDWNVLSYCLLLSLLDPAPVALFWCLYC